MKKLALLFFATLTFGGLMGLVADGKPTYRLEADPAMAGHDYWKGRSVTKSTPGGQGVPIQLPGPLDSWAGGDAKELVILLPQRRTTTLLIELLDSHESAPPTLAVVTGGATVGKLNIKPGAGRGNHHWMRYGSRSRYALTVHRDDIGRDRSVSIRSVQGSWIALESITLYQEAPAWHIWKSLGGRAALWVTLVGLAGLIALCLLLATDGDGRKLKLALFSLVAMVSAPLLFFSSLEGTLILLDIADPAKAEDPYVGFQTYVPLFVNDPADDGSLIFNVKRGISDQRIPKVKSKDVIRVALFGGSNTYKFNPEIHLFAQRLQTALGKKVETLNFGLPGYGSHRIVPMMDEAIGLDADILLIYSGHNEFLEKRFFKEHIDEAAWLTALRLRMQKWRLYQFSRLIFRKAKQATIGFHAATDRKEADTGRVDLNVTEVNVNWSKSSNPDQAALVLAQYEANLRRMVSRAKEAGLL